MVKATPSFDLIHQERMIGISPALFSSTMDLLAASVPS
jgi:hypothetical protein